MKKISIIIPVYNASATLDRCLCSVIDQTYDYFEVILVDDGSVDESPAICDRYVEEDARFRVIHQANAGVSAARNAGMKVADGDFLMFLDADDVLSHEALEVMSSKDCDLVLGGFRKVVSGKIDYVRVPKYDKVYEGTMQISAFLNDNIGRTDCFMLNSSCFKLYRRSLVYDNALKFDEALKYGEDKMFVFNFLKYITSARTVDKVVYDYILVEDSLSSDVKSDAHIEQVFLLLKSYIPLLQELTERYPDSLRLKELYHVDVVSRYVMRILTCYATGRSALMTEDNISLLYSYMADDKELKLSTVRLKQIPNLLLQRIGKPRFTQRFYSFTSSISR